MSRARLSCGLLWSGLALALVLALAAVLVPWWLQWQSTRQDAEAVAARIARYRALLDSRPALEQQLQRVQQWMERSGYFIRADNPELAAARLQKRIKDLVSQAGGTLISTQTLAVDPSQPGGLLPVAVQVRMKGDMDSLAKVFYGLESSTPVLVVEALSLRGRRVIRGRRRQRVEGYVVDASFKVSGYLLENTP